MNRNNNCSNDYSSSSSSSSSNNNNNNNNDDDSGSHFLSAWREVWKDLQIVLRAIPDLSSDMEPQDEELIKFPDKSVEALAQSLVGDVYLSASKCQSNPETIEDHQNKLLSSLISELDAQPQGHTVRIR